MQYHFGTLTEEGKIKMLLLQHVWLFLCCNNPLLLIEMHLSSLNYLISFSSGLTGRIKTYFCNRGCSGSAMYSSISTSLFILIILPYNFLVQWFLSFQIFSIFFDFRVWFLTLTSEDFFTNRRYRIISKKSFLRIIYETR